MLFALIKERRLAGMTQRKLGAMVGIHASKLSLIETGQVTPDEALQQRLAAALRTTPPVLFPELQPQEEASA